MGKGERHLLTLQANSHWATLLASEGHLGQAESRFLFSYDSYRAQLGDKHVLTYQAAGALGRFYCDKVPFIVVCYYNLRNYN